MLYDFLAGLSILLAAVCFFIWVWATAGCCFREWTPKEK